MCETLITLASYVASFARDNKGALMMLDPIDCLIIMHVRGNIHCQYNRHCLTTNTSNIYPSNLGMVMNFVLTLASSVDAFTREENGAVMRA